MLADDLATPTSLVPGRTNPFQQVPPQGNAGPTTASQLQAQQRKRPRDDGDFLDNRPLSAPLAAAGGPTDKRLYDSSAKNGDNQQGQALPSSNSTKFPGADQLASQIVSLFRWS